MGKWPPEHIINQNGETLLTKPHTVEQKQQIQKQDLDWSRFQLLLDICLNFYQSDVSKNDLASFTKLIVQIGEDFATEGYDLLPNKGMFRLIGETIIKAVKLDHDKAGGNRPISNKNVFKSLVKELVKKAHEDGHPKNKTCQSKTETAFEFVAKLLCRYGITNKGRPYKASTISNWCDDESL